MIYIKMIAYNAENTLNRAVDSVLNQTYKNFKFYLCDNGSTDGGKTKKIIEEYARKDARIVPFYNEVNRIWDINHKIITLAHDIEDEDIYCTLDADDEYKIIFLEEMLLFMNEENLDIVACGNDFINASDNRVISQRISSQNLVIEGDDFANCFPEYHQFIRTIWGKLFKGKTLKKTYLGVDPNDPIPRAYGNDTFLTMCALKSAKRFGVLAKSLHKYYISDKSNSYHYHPDRVKCDIILHEAALETLKPYGALSLRNLVFLYAVYHNASKDTLNVIFNSQISINEKIEAIHEVFSSKYLKDVLVYVLRNNDTFQYKQLRKNILAFMLNQSVAYDFIHAHLISEVIDNMYFELSRPVSDKCFEFIIREIPILVTHLMEQNFHELIDELENRRNNHHKEHLFLLELELVALSNLNVSVSEYFDFLVKALVSNLEIREDLNFDKHMYNLLSSSPLLDNLTIELVLKLQDTIRYVLLNDLNSAFHTFISTKYTSDNPSDLELYILMGLNLSALTENENEFIRYKKKMIRYLIDNLRVDEAIDELNEYDLILPNDGDLIKLRKDVQKKMI